MTMGSSLLVASALVGAIVAVVNYFMPDNGIAGTPGALVVIGSTVLLALVGWALRNRAGHGSAWRTLLYVATLVLVVGTAFAAWLLESPVLVATMAAAALGWAMAVFGRSASRAG